LQRCDGVIDVVEINDRDDQHLERDNFEPGSMARDTADSGAARRAVTISPKLAVKSTQVVLVRSIFRTPLPDREHRLVRSPAMILVVEIRFMVTQLLDITFPWKFAMTSICGFFASHIRNLQFLSNMILWSMLLVHSGEGSGPSYEGMSQPLDNGWWCFPFWVRHV
jgi:hypothetical protein